MDTITTEGVLCHNSTQSPAHPRWRGQFSYYRYKDQLLREKIVGAIGPARTTFDALLCHADTDGVAVPTVERLADELCLSKRAVQYHLRILQRLGAILLEHVGVAGGGMRNRYWIMPVRAIKTQLGALPAGMAGAGDAGARAVRTALSAVAGRVRRASARRFSVPARGRAIAPLLPEDATADCTPGPVAPFSKNGDTKNGGVRARDTSASSSVRGTPVTEQEQGAEDERALFAALAAAMGWTEVPAPTRQLWRPAARRLLASHTAEDAAACVRWFFSDGWWREHWEHFKLWKVVDKIDTWCAAGRPPTQAGRSAVASAKAPAMAIPTYDLLMEQAAAEAHVVCPVCRGVDRHYYCARYGHDTPVTTKHVGAGAVS